jgi:hypothetical protein
MIIKNKIVEKKNKKIGLMMVRSENWRGKMMKYMN